VEIIFRCAPKGTPIPQGFEINRAEWFELNSLPDSLSEDQRWLIRRAFQYTQSQEALGSGY